MMLISSKTSAAVYSNLRQRIEYIPFDSTAYTTWINRAAIQSWDKGLSGLPPGYIKPKYITLTHNGEWIYEYAKKGEGN